MTKVLDNKEVHYCPCGNRWFEGGTLSFDPRGNIIDAVGWLKCSECGRPRVIWDGKPQGYT